MNMHNLFEFIDNESYYSKFIKLLLKILNKKNSFNKTIEYYYKNNQIPKDIFESPTPSPIFFNDKDYITMEFKKKKLYIFNQKNHRNKTIILYFHGGAFIRNFYLFHWSFIKSLMSYASYPIYAVDYPLIPFYNYEKILNFCKELYLWLIQKYKIILIGDSAGGNLCLSVIQKIESNLFPKKIILLSPWLDVSMTNPQIIEYEDYDFILNQEGLKKAGSIYSNFNPKLPEVSPIYYDYNFLPETHLFIGTHDILYPDCELFYKKYKKNNIYFYKYHKMVHDWMILNLFPFKGIFKEADSVHNFLKELIYE